VFDFMLILAGVYLTATLISTLVLAASLFLVENVKESSFKKYGTKSTFLRCAGICLATTIGPVLVFADDPTPMKDGSMSNIPGVTPFWGVLALVVWFAGIIYFFRKGVGQTVALFVINLIFGIAMAGAIRFLLLRFLLKGVA
jgi:hypothetical protein